MKKLTFYVAATLLLLTIISTNVKAGRNSTKSALDSAQTLESAKVLLTRLDEINAIDKAGLSSIEVRKLRKELRGIKGNLKELDGGVYLPIGTLAIILLVPFIVFSVAQ
jgi:hypothetical protein